MKKYLLFRSADGGVLIQHPDDNDAMADGDDLVEALTRMHDIEKLRGLEHIQNQLFAETAMERVA